MLDAPVELRVYAGRLEFGVEHRGERAVVVVDLDEIERVDVVGTPDICLLRVEDRWGIEVASMAMDGADVLRAKNVIDRARFER